MSMEILEIRGRVANAHKYLITALAWRKGECQRATLNALEARCNSMVLPHMGSKDTHACSASTVDEGSAGSTQNERRPCEACRQSRHAIAIGVSAECSPRCEAVSMLRRRHGF
ncbi:hypothetical protein KC19_10G024900 [Ceratodon purpureus]|uniref:Uncharacterized protein n=1 Tax=Ceratodon purpureus TaxID=3225 RepID=A0A8T0GJH6_CERPU|nr:hypothetical protein KC19_10G024900 [Ceratodon purpureus]